MYFNLLALDSSLRFIIMKKSYCLFPAVSVHQDWVTSSCPYKDVLADSMFSGILGLCFVHPRA